MSGNDVALDTSAAIKLLNDSVLAQQFLSRVGKVYIPAIAAGELVYGAANSNRASENVPRYQAFIANCQVLSISLQTAMIYAEQRLLLKRKAFPIPDADIWIAASALEKSLPIVTTDRHFSYINDLGFFSLQ